MNSIETRLISRQISNNRLKNEANNTTKKLIKERINKLKSETPRINMQQESAILIPYQSIMNYLRA